MADRVKDIVEWLFDSWQPDAPLAIVEGFPGIGKTTAVQQYVRAWAGPKVHVTLVDDLIYEEFLLSLVSDLEDAGSGHLVAEGDWERSLVKAIRSKALLVVLDNFQTQLDTDGRISSSDMKRFIESVATGHSGRLCVITSRTPLADHWNQRAQYRTMRQPDVEHACDIFKRLLRERGVEDELDDESLLDVATWLGFNPRAMRAFAACFVGQSLEEIIDRDSDSWEMRHLPRSAQFLEQLEKEFWDKTLGRLQDASITLAENLAVYRKPFRVEAIKAAGGTLPNWENARNGLSQSFILDRTGAWYELNPVVRQLAASRLAARPSRQLTAHARAADFFAKRVDTRSYRDANKSGTAFVEVRYHYYAAGRADLFDGIARNFRAQLLRLYESTTLNLTDVQAARQRIPVLLSALDHDDGGFHHLRSALVQLLETRGGEGDDILALRHARVASQEPTPLAFWRSYARIAGRIESDAYLSSLGKRAVVNCVTEPERVVVDAAEQLYLRGNTKAALELLEHAADGVKDPAEMYLTRLKSFILDRIGRFEDAFNALLQYHKSTGPGRLVDRLVEEAVILAYQHASRQHLDKAIAYINSYDAPLSRNSLLLASMLTLMLDEDYGKAAEAGESDLRDTAIVTQVAFCYLVSNRPSQASNYLPELGTIRNVAAYWLTALISVHNGDMDTYSTALANSLENLEDVDLDDEKAWLYVWDQVPDSMQPYPSYYFPRLPTSLTGLDGPISRTPASGSQRRAIANVVSTQKATAVQASLVPKEASVSEPYMTPSPINIFIGGNSVSKDEYNVTGSTGALGRGASVNGDVTQYQLTESSLRDALIRLQAHARAQGDVEVARALGELNASAADSDGPPKASRFADIAAWLTDKAADATVGVYAGLVVAAFGAS